jgi:hypothetical protein
MVGMAGVAKHFHTGAQLLKWKGETDTKWFPHTFPLYIFNFAFFTVPLAGHGRERVRRRGLSRGGYRAFAVRPRS